VGIWHASERAGDAFGCCCLSAVSRLAAVSLMYSMRGINNTYPLSLISSIKLLQGDENGKELEHKFSD
jgi:hypothetical protein